MASGYGIGVGTEVVREVLELSVCLVFCGLQN